MQEYRHVLFATDLSPKAAEVGQHAQGLAARYGARLSFVHVIEGSQRQCRLRTDAACRMPDEARPWGSKHAPPGWLPNSVCRR